jgi:hypothetical protein
MRLLKNNIMTEENKLTESESLRLIEQMIKVAKDEHQERGEAWLYWGWFIFIASVLSAILGFMEQWKYVSWVWNGALIAALLLFIFLQIKKRKEFAVKTYAHELIGRLATGFFISLLACIAASFIGKTGSSFSFGYYYIIYAFWMYIYGSAIRFRPFIIGAFFNWAGALAIFWVDDFKIDMIISAVAVFAGYLIPGYLLNAQYRKQL